MRRDKEEKKNCNKNRKSSKIDNRRKMVPNQYDEERSIKTIFVYTESEREYQSAGCSLHSAESLLSGQAVETEFICRYFFR